MLPSQLQLAGMIEWITVAEGSGTGEMDLEAEAEDSEGVEDAAGAEAETEMRDSKSSHHFTTCA